MCHNFEIRLTNIYFDDRRVYILTGCRCIR
nr:MAG TPA: hypothetical protein [Caudoviricetes sp.]